MCANISIILVKSKFLVQNTLFSAELSRQEFLWTYFMSKISTDKIAMSDFRRRISAHEFVCTYML